MEESELKFFMGQQFSSFKEVESYFNEFNKVHCTHFSITRSEKCNDPVVKYKYVVFGCKHYGERRDNPKATGQRPKQKTYKIGCEAFVHLTRQSKINKLSVFKLHLNHNHDCNEVTVAGYPENRNLSDAGKASVLEYAKLKAKPTLVKPLLRQSEGPNKMILSRDISNIRTKAKLMLRNGRSDEQMLIDKLAEVQANDPKAVTHIEFDSVSKEVIFILIQTSEMREMLHLYPEVLLMDITYKINKNRMPVSVIEVMDGEGLGEVVAYAFLANELKETLTSALMCFAEASGEGILDQTNCVVVDKDFSEIGAVKVVMPNAKIHLCSVHVERNLKAAATGDKQRKQLIEAFRDMVYAETEEDFECHLQKFKAIASNKLNLYFEKNWLKSKEAWALKDRILVKTLRNHTTNRVESHNQKLKMIFSVDTELYEAIDGIVNILMENRRDDLRYRAHESLTKKTVILKCSNPLVSEICNDLSDYAAKIINEQLNLSSNPSPFPEKYNVSEVSCSCSLFKTMELPCRHIMRLRKEKGLVEYDKNNVPKRWWVKPRQNLSKSTGEQGAANSTVLKARMPAERVACVLNSREKFKEVAPLSQKLSSLVVDSGTKTYHRRRQLLSDIVQAWSKGEEVALVHLSQNSQAVFVDGSTEQQPSLDTPFQLNIMKVAGKPRGIEETVHDGSKKKGRQKKKVVVSIDDGPSPDDPDPSNELDPTDGDEINGPGKDNKEPFKLTTVITKGRPAATNTKKKSWSYRAVADEECSKCCICKEEMDNFDFCNKCHNRVHALVPCSTEDERGVRLCNFCSDYSVGSQDLSESFLCLGCSRSLERTIWTKSGNRQGCFYYRCKEGETPNCKKTFAFWAPRIASKPQASEHSPSQNSEDLNEDEHDSENVHGSPTCGSDDDHESPSEQIESDVSESEELSQENQSGLELRSVERGGLSQTTVEDCSQKGIGSLEEWRKQCETCNEYGESAFNWLDFCETCGAPVHTGDKSCSVAFGDCDDDRWVCLLCNNTAKTREKPHSDLPLGDQTSASANVEVIVIDSDSDSEPIVWPVKEENDNAKDIIEELNNSKAIDEEINNFEDIELNQAFDGRPQTLNIQETATCEKVSKKAEVKKKKTWKCFTCGNRDIELRSVTTFGVNFQRKYYGCFSKDCTAPKPFLFWAPKTDDSSETIVPPEERGNVTVRRKRGAPLRSVSEGNLGDSAPQGNEEKRPKRLIQLPIKLRNSFNFDTP